jgi:hypothetical protein
MIHKILFIVLSSFTFISTAQNNDSRRLSINIVPQYLIIAGIRTDVEYMLTDKVNIFAGMQYYSGTINTSGIETREANATSSNVDQSKRANDKLEGNGWNAGIKYYFLKEQAYNYYLGADFIHNKFDISIKEYGYFPYVDDGLTFYEYRLGNIETDSKQYGYNVSAGLTTTHKKFVVNGWVGFGYTETQLSKDFNKFRKYNSYSGQYAYQGFAPYLGFKIGYLLF